MTSPPGPDHTGQDRPVTDQELAALAADALDAERARRLRARLAGDPALLSRYGALRAAHTPTTTGADAPGPVAPARGHAVPGRWARPGRMGVVAATAVGVAAALGWLTSTSAVTAPLPAPDTTPVVAIASGQLASLWPGLGTAPADPGFLTEQGRLSSCLNAFAPPQVLGARPVILDDRYGVAVAWVAADDPATVELVVYSRDCGPLGDGVLARTSLPR